MTARRRRVLQVAVLLALLGGVLWFALSRVEPRAAAQGGRVAVAGALPASAPVDIRLMGLAASGAASAPALHHAAAAPGSDARAELARRMKADWCGFGAAERDRQTEAVYDKATATTGTIGMEAIAEARETVAGRLMEEAQGEVRRRWVRALTQRGDVRSLGVADYLEASNADEASPAARARLQARARTSSDPMVTALALQRPCAAGTCINIEASQWSRLEPANLQAWLALLTDSAGRARQTHASYALDRLAQEAQYSRTYQHELQAVLLSLPQSATPGLPNEAEIQFVMETVFAWPIAPMRPLLDLCRSSLPDAGTVSRCERVAQLLWQQDDQFNRAFGLGIARALVAARPEMRSQWEPQAREYEAVNEWSQGEPERVASRLLPEPMPPCGWQPEIRKMWQASLGRGEWEALRAGMREAGEDDASLSARWRKREGRSALDPLSTPRQASAPAKAG